MCVSYWIPKKAHAFLKSRECACSKRSAKDACQGSPSASQREGPWVFFGSRNMNSSSNWFEESWISDLGQLEEWIYTLNIQEVMRLRPANVARYSRTSSTIPRTSRWATDRIPNLRNRGCLMSPAAVQVRGNASKILLKSSLARESLRGFDPLGL